MGRYAYIPAAPRESMVWKNTTITAGSDWEPCSSCGKKNVPLVIVEVWHQGAYHYRDDDAYCRDCVDERTWAEACNGE